MNFIVNLGKPAFFFLSAYNTARLSFKLASLNGLLNLIIFINAVFDSKKQRFVYNREMVFQNNAALLSSYNHLVFFIVPPPQKRKTASHFIPWEKERERERERERENKLQVKHIAQVYISVVIAIEYMALSYKYFENLQQNFPKKSCACSFLP